MQQLLLQEQLLDLGVVHALKLLELKLLLLVVLEPHLVAVGIDSEVVQRGLNRGVSFILKGILIHHNVTLGILVVLEHHHLQHLLLLEEGYLFRSQLTARHLRLNLVGLVLAHSLKVLIEFPVVAILIKVIWLSLVQVADHLYLRLSLSEDFLFLHVDQVVLNIIDR